MKADRRNRAFVLLAAVAGLLVLTSVAAPVFAWHVTSFSTSLPASSFAIGTTIIDTANLQLSAQTVPSTYVYGTITFSVYKGTCNPATGLGTGTLVTSLAAVTVTSASNGASHPYPSPGWSSTGQSANSYYFVAVYSGSSSQSIGGVLYGGYPGATAGCEPFTLFKGPPFGAPEFPLGPLLVIALALPALLLIRSKFTAPKTL